MVKKMMMGKRECKKPQENEGTRKVDRLP